MLKKQPSTPSSSLSTYAAADVTASLLEADGEVAGEPTLVLPQASELQEEEVSAYLRDEKSAVLFDVCDSQVLASLVVLLYHCLVLCAQSKATYVSCDCLRVACMRC